MNESDMVVGEKEFVKASRDYLLVIEQVLNDQYGELCGWPAGRMVDIGFEVAKESGKVGIRLDNNFGVVGSDDATKFAEALNTAVGLAATFMYLGYEVV